MGSQGCLSLRSPERTGCHTAEMTRWCASVRAYHSLRCADQCVRCCWRCARNECACRRCTRLCAPPMRGRKTEAPCLRWSILCAGPRTLGAQRKAVSGGWGLESLPHRCAYDQACAPCAKHICAPRHKRLGAGTVPRIAALRMSGHLRGDVQRKELGSCLSACAERCTAQRALTVPVRIVQAMVTRMPALERKMRSGRAEHDLCARGYGAYAVRTEAQSSRDGNRPEQTIHMRKVNATLPGTIGSK